MTDTKNALEEMPLLINGEIAGSMSCWTWLHRHKDTIRNALLEVDGLRERLDNMLSFEDTAQRLYEENASLREQLEANSAHIGDLLDVNEENAKLKADLANKPALDAEVREQLKQIEFDVATGEYEPMQLFTKMRQLIRAASAVQEKK